MKECSQRQGFDLSDELSKAFIQLATWENEKILHKILVVRKKVFEKSKRNVDRFNGAGIRVYRWLDSMDWLRMATGVGIQILEWLGEKEDGETYKRLLYYYYQKFGNKKKGHKDHADFLMDLGYTGEQAKNAAYRYQKQLTTT